MKPRAPRQLGPLVLLLASVSLSACAPWHKPVYPPRLDIRWVPAQAMAGHALQLEVQAQPADLEIQISADSQSLTLAAQANPAQPGCFRGYLAIPLENVPTSFSLTLTAVSKPGEVLLSKLYTIPMLPRPQDLITNLWIRNISQYDYSGESAVMAAARRQASSVPRTAWDFLSWPLQGRISEQFGVIRNYNRGIRNSRHTGLDIAAAQGTIVQAPGPGIVLLSEEFKAHGKTILINHGYGVVSTFLHLSKMNITSGQTVSQNEAIGEVGSTGASTGPHLHFQVNINGIPIDPRDLFQE
ncbi:MAG: M23 family metallopeptidase [candidate division FCPU426 bacterium]